MDFYNINIIRSQKIINKQIRAATKKKNRKTIRKSKRYLTKKESKTNAIKKRRSEIRKRILQEYRYDKPQKTISLDGDIGIEDSRLFHKYIDFGCSVINANSEDLCIDLINCTRVWPSSIVLLCSLKKWMELSCIINKCDHPNISSLSPKEDFVENYLIHSGFYDFVGRQHPSVKIFYPDSEIVKIKRETNRDKIIDREKEFDNLVKKYSNLSNDQYELFTCKVIPEIINNVIEHGITAYDQGWWLLGQYHKTHGIISICIADNGIGFRENLLSGPQRDEILLSIEDKGNNDGDFIKLAFIENISGAYSASQKESGFIFKNYERGARRGHGLKRIYSTCKECKVCLSIISHFGYISFDEDGNTRESSSSEDRIFAGTLYQLIIPAKVGGLP